MGSHLSIDNLNPVKVTKNAGSVERAQETRKRP